MFFDSPPPEQPSTIPPAEKLQAESQKQGLELVSANGQPATAGSTDMPMEYGSIKDITLDGQWKKFESTSPQLLQVKGESYVHEGVTDRSLIYHEYWLADISGSPETQSAVLRTLSEPDHRLTKSEIEGIHYALSTAEERADRFDIKDAWTKHVNGGQVLFIEGIYKTDPGKGAYEFSAYPVSGEFPGTLPERLSYVADIKGDYTNFVKSDQHQQIVSAFESMKFKRPGTYEVEPPTLEDAYPKDIIPKVQLQ